MTEHTKEYLIRIVEKRINDYEASIIKQEKMKLFIIKNANYFTNPANEIVWRNRQINNLKELIEENKKSMV